MGYAMVWSACFGCGQVFGYNPMTVPSHRDNTGERQPVCQGCMTIVNAERVRRGHAPFPIAADAYEACDETELG